MKEDGRKRSALMASRDPEFIVALRALAVGILLEHPQKVATRHYLRMLQNANHNWTPKYFIYKPLDNNIYVVRIR